MCASRLRVVVSRTTAIVCAGLLWQSAVLPALAVSLSWSVIPSPHQTTPEGGLNGVACATSTNCVAVGQHVNALGMGSALAEVWNGSTWSLSSPPSPGGDTSVSLASVACTSTAACVAVGTAGVQTTSSTLAETWNGAQWSIQSSPNPGGASYSALTSVSCSSANACETVGSAYVSGTTSALVEAWNGTQWSIQSTPSPVGSTTNLTGVSCTSASFCTAVGAAYDSITGAQSTLAETWNGTQWSLQTTPNPANSTASLSAISCTSGIACTAVGDFSTATSTGLLAEGWNGTAWTIETVPSPTGTTGTLVGISCTSATACVAVGSADDGTNIATLAETWDGTQWSIRSTPNPAGLLVFLNAAWCTSVGMCMAVGATDVNSSPSRNVTLAEAWDGTVWSIESTPNPNGVIPALLYAVSCSSGTTCTAVGGHTPLAGARGDTPGLILVETWNGSAWAVAAAPNPAGATQANLAGVSCASATLCTAVGAYAANGTLVTLAEAMNGTQWAIQATPNPANLDAELSGVSCISATACTAAGTSTDPNTGATATLAEIWNGTQWAMQTTPNPANMSAEFSGVSCTSATACTAVGTATDPNTFASATLAEIWNGTQWSIQTTPNPTNTSSGLSGVSCTSATACTAVGTAYDSVTGASATLAEMWNGTQWSIQTSPNPANMYPVLSGVSCTSVTACTAVGTAVDSVTGASATLAERWDGSVWSIQTTANPARAAVSLAAVACASLVCFGVGYYSYLLTVPIALIEGPRQSVSQSGPPSPSSRSAVNQSGSASPPPRIVDSPVVSPSRRENVSRSVEQSSP